MRSLKIVHCPNPDCDSEEGCCVCEHTGFIYEYALKAMISSPSTTVPLQTTRRQTMSVQMQSNFYDTNQKVLKQVLTEFLQDKGIGTTEVQTILTNYERELARQGWNQQELSQIQPQQKSKSAQG